VRFAVGSCRATTVIGVIAALDSYMPYYDFASTFGREKNRVTRAVSACVGDRVFVVPRPGFLEDLKLFVALVIAPPTVRTVTPCLVARLWKMRGRQGPIEAPATEVAV